MRGNIYMPCEVILQESLDRPTGRNHPKSSYPLITSHAKIVQAIATEINTRLVISSP
jgi:hypothetical protein